RSARLFLAGFALRRAGEKEGDGYIERVARTAQPRSPTRPSLTYSVQPPPSGWKGEGGVHPHPATSTGSLQLRLQARPESAQLLRERLYVWLDELGVTSDEIFD